MRKLSEAEKAELQKKLLQPKVRRKSVFDELREKIFSSSGDIRDEPIHSVSARVSNINARFEERSAGSGRTTTKYTASIITIVFQSNDSSMAFELDSDKNPHERSLDFLLPGDKGILVTRAGELIDFYKNMTIEDINKLSGKTDKAT